MPGICELTGVGVLSGNRVSHSNRRTRRKFFPNLQSVTLNSEILRKKMKLKIAARTLRTIDFKGGLDQFLILTKSNKLSPKAKILRSRIKLKLHREGEVVEEKQVKTRKSVAPSKKSLKKTAEVVAKKESKSTVTKTKVTTKKTKKEEE